MGRGGEGTNGEAQPELPRLASRRERMGYFLASRPRVRRGTPQDEHHLFTGGSQQVIQRQLKRLAGSLGMLLLFASLQPGPWSASDKTAIDLETPASVTATQHAHPRGARQYHYDGTEVDLATRLPTLQPERPQAAPDPAPVDTPEAVPATEEELSQ